MYIQTSNKILTRALTSLAELNEINYVEIWSKLWFIGGDYIIQQKNILKLKGARILLSRTGIRNFGFFHILSINCCCERVRAKELRNNYLLARVYTACQSGTYCETSFEPLQEPPFLRKPLSSKMRPLRRARIKVRIYRNRTYNGINGGRDKNKTKKT